jgi:hypothetical protein
VLHDLLRARPPVHAIMSNSAVWSICITTLLCACAEQHELPVEFESAVLDAGGPALPDAQAETARVEHQWRQLRQSLSRSREQVTVEELPGGIVHMRTNGGFRSASIVVRDPRTGNVRRECIDSPSAADRVFGRTP